MATHCVMQYYKEMGTEDKDARTPAREILLLCDSEMLQDSRFFLHNMCLCRAKRCLLAICGIFS